MADHVVYTDEANKQIVDAVRSEARRNQSRTPRRARWHRSPGSVETSSALDICDPCSCCDELDEQPTLLLKVTRIKCCRAGEYDCHHITAAPGIFQSDAFTCSDGYATEWTIDTNVDPVTATCRTTNGDAVFSLAAADFNVYCGNRLDVSSVPSGCSTAPCVCVGPKSCANNYPCSSSSVCQEQDIPETITMSFARTGDADPVGPDVWELQATSITLNRRYSQSPAEVQFVGQKDIVFDVSTGDTVTVEDAVFSYIYDCETSTWRAQLAFCGYCVGSSYEGPETAFVPDSGDVSARPCDFAYQSARCSFQRYVNCHEGTGNTTCNGTNQVPATVDLYAGTTYFHDMILTVS